MSNTTHTSELLKAGIIYSKTNGMKLSGKETFNWIYRQDRKKHLGVFKTCCNQWRSQDMEVGGTGLSLHYFGMKTASGDSNFMYRHIW